jgi:DNA N-6-adenine-methyltransferase Dam
VLGEIDLDPASSLTAQKAVKAKRFHALDDDGLKHKWSGRIFLNPPFAQPHLKRFVDKLIHEYQAGKVTEAILLTPNNTDTEWFHSAARAAKCICFTRGRISFYNEGRCKEAATQGQTFFYFGDNANKFTAMFGKVGLLMQVFAEKSFNKVVEYLEAAE